MARWRRLHRLAGQPVHGRLPAALFLLGAALVGVCGHVAAQPPVTESPPEYAVKATFLYSFARYVEWPTQSWTSADQAFVIGVLGEDPFGEILLRIAETKTVHGRRVVFRHFPSADDYQPPCHLLFVGRSVEAQQQWAIVERLQGSGVLLVGESPGFAQRGGVLNFFLEGDHVRFEINPLAARREQLRLDAKLLSLGRPVSAPDSPQH